MAILSKRPILTSPTTHAEYQGLRGGFNASIFNDYADGVCGDERLDVEGRLTVCGDDGLQRCFPEQHGALTSLNPV